eukprot:CAMPEP_0172183192 /NCGR_PEP_ID=MMETSP1050-20130122/18840_1 /TAXON_ID=233186 /ORGANISM="Cryptomonas curvata, Strain CCAP979/52" /LENGTH=182 /DNA_ID=CAMNT_0012856765 /DNA_START=197 /DNA_END=745 /DNA_ORIENTATION=-
MASAAPVERKRKNERLRLGACIIFGYHILDTETRRHLCEEPMVNWKERMPAQCLSSQSTAATCEQMWVQSVEHAASGGRRWRGPPSHRKAAASECAREGSIVNCGDVLVWQAPLPPRRAPPKSFAGAPGAGVGGGKKLIRGNGGEPRERDQPSLARTGGMQARCVRGRALRGSSNRDSDMRL